jgi:Icc-related predicted phosphoesterase
VRLLAFSDIHRDLRQAERIADRASGADVVVAAGDFASIHRGLEELIDMLVVIEQPTVLVPGNNETLDALRHACRGWRAAHVLHGDCVELDGVEFFGLGGGVPTTPWDWSFDLTDEEADELLAACPDDAVLVSHSPPKGHLDGRDLGSEAVLRAIERARPPVAVCGHIHECAGEQDRIGPTRLYNLGPEGTFIDVNA